MKYSLLLAPALQPTLRLMPCPGHINHPTHRGMGANWRLTCSVDSRPLREGCWRGDRAVGDPRGAAVHGHRDQTLPSNTGVLRKARVQGRVLSHCTPESGFGVRAWGCLCAPSCWGHRRAWPVPAEPRAGSVSPVGPGREALSLPGTLIKALRRRPPPSPLATHTNYILYVFYLLCRF